MCSNSSNSPLSDQSPYTCPECHKVFRGKAPQAKQNLRQHFRTVHLKLRDYTCEMCGKSYSTRFYMRQHQRKHHVYIETIARDGERWAKCGFCIRGFKGKNRRPMMKRHILAVHFNVKNHCCETCGKKFFRRSDLERHAKGHLNR
ncbi:hypothetical protein ACHWQZ_G005931 [Mnemiopsis leidyi]